MLSKETFIKGITVLQKIFLNWTFNSKDALMVSLWYKALNGIDDKDFLRVVETYCKTRVKAPNSPNELLMILAEEEEKKWMNPEQAFNLVRELIREYGWSYGSKDIYNGVRNNPALYETVREFEYDLRELTVNDQFTPKRFKEAYAIKLKTMAMKTRDEKLTAAAQVPVIESGSMGRALPYEK